jgi:hypothetical protein
MIIQRILFQRHLDSEEKLLFIAHKHWIEIVPQSLKMSIFGIVLPLVLWFFFPGIMWVSIVWMVSFWFWYLYILADWYFDAWLATDVSLIDVEWIGIFHHMSTRIPYSEVREIQWEINGILGTIFRFGSASVSMATGGQVSLSPIASPKKVELKIIQARDSFLSRQKMNQSQVLQELLSDMLASHIDQRGIPHGRL